jgi:hypothetical protein
MSEGPFNGGATIPHSRLPKVRAAASAARGFKDFVHFRQKPGFFPTKA